MKLILIIATLFFSTEIIAQVQKQFINPTELIKPSGYTHVVVTKSANTTIYIAGEVPFNSKGELIGKGDFRAQVIQVYENMKAALKAAGADFDDVVKMNTYIGNYNPEYLKVVREVRSIYLSKENPPANTTVGVVLSPDVLIEMEAIAVLK
jgi:enamine deaminase RidA (YjgF/YER057c/UK114 family)